MAKRPTHKPLTKTERTELDRLIRRAAGAINSADGSRLVRLLDLDQADRAQERRTAGGMDRINRELAQKLKAAEDRIAAATAELKAIMR